MLEQPPKKLKNAGNDLGYLYKVDQILKFP